MARSLGCTRRHALVRRTAASLPADRWGSETQSTTERPRRERERDTQARSGEAKHACANEESWRPPPSKARHLSFAQSRGQQQLRASLCGTKWVGPRMTWAGEESLPSTSSHRRRLPSLLPPTPHPSVPRHHHHLLTRVLPPPWRGALGTCWRRAFRSRVFIGAWRRRLGLAIFTRLVALRRRHSDKPRWALLVIALALSHTAWLGSLGFASSGMQPSPLSLLVFLI
jgi:hypothetical protein